MSEKKLINANGAKKHIKLAFSPLLSLFIYRRGAWTYDTPSSSSFSLSIPFPFLLFERKSQKFLAVSIKKRIFAADKKWIYVLKYMEEIFKNLPSAEQKKMLDYLAKLPDVRYLSSEEQEKYDESIKAVDDYYSGLYGSYVEGEEKGIAKGRVEGRAEGRAEGELSKGLTVARNLLAIGMSWPQIMQITGLTEEQLRQLKS